MTSENIICLLAGLPVGAWCLSLWLLLRERRRLRRLRRPLPPGSVLLP